jgi:hypothetical protein
MEQFVIGIVTLLNVGTTQTGIEFADRIVPTAAVRFGAATAINAVDNQNVGNFRLRVMEFPFEILSVFPSLTRGHIAQALTERVDEVLRVRLAGEIHGSILRQLVSGNAGAVATLGFDVALPLMARPMSSHPRRDVMPDPLNDDGPNRRMFGNQNFSLELLRGFLAERRFAYGGSAVVDYLLPVALNLDDFCSHGSLPPRYST